MEKAKKIGKVIAAIAAFIVGIIILIPLTPIIGIIDFISKKYYKEIISSYTDTDDISVSYNNKKNVVAGCGAMTLPDNFTQPINPEGLGKNGSKHISVMFSTLGVIHEMSENKTLDVFECIRVLARHEFTHVKQIQWLQSKYENWDYIAAKINEGACQMRASNEVSKYSSEPMESGAYESQVSDTMFFSYNPEKDQVFMEAVKKTADYAESMKKQSGWLFDLTDLI